ncbi:MAG: 5-(carboxyamino)imidazole ribonucleotide synthase [Gemmatimonas sp.]|nr:5-(carboxyamino)imidazole ribonucleotide synthase [Gemmatimonas sp.]
MRDSPILPGSTIGIVGGGQLGRMFVLEARRMGYDTVVLDPDERAPAGQIANGHIVAPLTDLEAARELASRSDVVTLEWENADLAAVRALAERVPVRPGPHVLEIAQNRILEKEAAQRFGLETASFRAVRSRADLEEAVIALGLPAVLKTTYGGYDGKGQRVIHQSEGTLDAFAELGGGDAELILEGWVDFALEASVVSARSVRGDIVSFPIGENVHRRGILDFTIVPARIPDDVIRRCVEVGAAVMTGLDVVGVLAVELFVTRDHHILVNEIAPRPHNSGHYTWEACAVSQFEQQLRAICGLPLGDARLIRPAAMANLLGDDIGTGRGVPALVEALGDSSVALHLYGKAEARIGRKMGHLTALGDGATDAFERVARAREILISGPSDSG